MVFFLGKDVTVALATENQTNGVGIVVAGGDSAQLQVAADGSLTNAVAYALSGGAGLDINQLTACDVSIGAMDEDITYFGMRSVTKAEIKKETTITLTRKKTGIEWDTIFNDVRYGVNGTPAAWPGLEEPTINHGYRMFVTIDSGTGNDEVVTLMGCCVQGHTVTVNTDGTMDETLELMSYITPVFSNSAYTTAITAAQL